MHSFFPSSGHAPARGPTDRERPFRLFAVSGRRVVDTAGHGAPLWLLLRGRAELCAREGQFALGPRDWIALDRDSAPRILTSPDALMLGIDPLVATCRGSSAEGGPPSLFPGRGRLPARARGLALRLWRAHGAFDGNIARPADTEGLQGFLSSLQADLIGRIDRCPGHSAQHKRQVLQRMQRARLYLEGQPDAGLRIGEIARRVNFSPWYFSKVFHAVYDIGPLQFLARMRLQRASRLLSTTRLPVTEVSAACGFDNPCSFARAFRAQYGMTASEHRLRNARVGAAMRNGWPRASSPMARKA